MKYKVIPLDEFVALSEKSILIDVRSPREYKKGHIHGAVNMPLFNDEERAEVGTLYVRTSREDAIEKGLEIVGPKMHQFIKQIRALQAGENKVLCIYCWRGGMRSNSMAWLMSLYGFKVRLLEGGYKRYRKGLSELLEAHQWNFKILGGMTGCGKTDVLRAMKGQGVQVLDLEGLANHKGSAFGHMGMEEQPTTESFENSLYHEFLTYDPKKTVWMEGESRSIGTVFIPEALFSRMRNCHNLLYKIPVEQRLDRLCKDYGCFDKEMLVMCFNKIKKRLGFDQVKIAIEYLEQDNIREAARIALRYYDKSYQHSFDQRSQESPESLVFEKDDPEMAASEIINRFNDSTL